MVIVIPFVMVWGDTAPIGTTDRTAMGLYDRLLVGHSVRLVGVGWVSEPGRRIVIKTVRRRQPESLSQTRQDTHPTTLTRPNDQINSSANPCCRVEDGS